ncbi:cytochrome P450 71D11-like [Dendrobium catenatum]|uniref:cytochrome P450 71D11-like n=1 Tax=Dendrobium catenatum TaxID=906689 RepID=UPI00109F7526|nr:cytochrome P450 71D11-like [Dendrobium catenatum]
MGHEDQKDCKGTEAIDDRQVQRWTGDRAEVKRWSGVWTKVWQQSMATLKSDGGQAAMQMSSGYLRLADGCQKDVAEWKSNSNGPWKLPIIENLYQLLGEHPHHRLQNLAKAYGPLLHLKLGEINLIVITSREFVRDIFITHDLKFASKPKLMAGKIIFYNNTDIGLAPYGKTWSKLRKICILELLTLKRVTSFKLIREEDGNNLVEKTRMEGRSPINLSAMLLSISNVTIARAAFGKGSAQQQMFLLAMKKTFEYLSGFNVVDLFPSWSFLGEISGLRHGMERVHMEMDVILNEIIEEHEGKKLDGNDTKEDLIDVRSLEN